jgi:2-polyprenyl-6-methoxyphenol hydroxylase-like FAD-dependent oxidoreductase
VTARSALISGAGIAGPVVAFWLSRAGWDVTVVESAAHLPTSGFPVDLGSEAIGVVRRMGLHGEILARRYEHVPIEMLSARECRIGTMELGQGRDDGVIEISRSALSAILHQASRAHARYVFGDSIAALTQTDTGVDVRFGHRPPQTYDAVIGADGMHSRVRRLIFGHESQFIRHLGPYAAIWNLPDVDLFTSGTGFMYSHPGRSVIVECPADGSAARAFLTFAHPDPGVVNRHDADEVMHTIRGVFAEDGWRSGEIIDTLRAAEDFYFDTVSQIRMSRWSVGRVALVGDAAYAPSFLSGRSTSIAIAGAYVLASELANTDSPQHAFAAYERRLCGCVEQSQDLLRRN